MNKFNGSEAALLKIFHFNKSYRQNKHLNIKKRGPGAFFLFVEE